jgi:DNA polymerase-4
MAPQITDQLNYLFFDLNSYFASCEQQDRPELRGRPIGVVPMENVASTCCLAASYEAKAHGVKTGTTVAEARRLCPGIIFVKVRPALYVHYHEKIVPVVESCVPVETVMSIDEMACRLTGSQTDEVKATALALQIKARVREKVGACLTSSIGLAPNRFLAKVASDMQKPDGLTVLRKSELPGALYRLQIQDLPGIGPRMNRRLALVGVRTVETLCALTRAQMRRLWGGILGERFYLWLRGEEPYVPPSKTRCMGHQHVLSPELRTWTGAYTVLQKMLFKAAVRLRRGQFYARRIGIHIKIIGVPKEESYYEDALKVHESQDTLVFARALESLWAQVPHHQGRPLRVGVVLFDLIPASEHQYSLFENPRRETLARVIDELNERYGRGTVEYALYRQAAQAAPTRIAFSRIPKLDEMDP